MFSQYRLRELDSLMAENAINKPPAQPAALPGRRRFSELTLYVPLVVSTPSEMITGIYDFSTTTIDCIRLTMRREGWEASYLLRGLLCNAPLEGFTPQLYTPPNCTHPPTEHTPQLYSPVGLDLKLAKRAWKAP